MKYAIVILGGAADQPQPELDGRTPLEAADTPTLAHLAEVGRLGEVSLYPEDAKPAVPPGPDAALLALLGYRSEKRYPGRAPLHALGVGLPLTDGDWCFELSLLSVIDGVAQPSGALSIPGGEAEALIRGLLPHLDLPGAVVHPGQPTSPGTPAHLLIDPQSGAVPDVPKRDWTEVVTQRPDDIAGEPLRKAMPVGGRGGERLQALIEASEKQLAGHELNRARAEMGEPAVTHLWPWGQGRLPPGGRPVRPWADRFGRLAVVISGDPAVRGLARLAGLSSVDPAAQADDAGDDESLDPLSRLAQVAVDALADDDVVIVHTDVPQRAGRDAGPRDKVSAIEQVDGRLLKPIMRALESYDGPHRLLATPLHTTLLATRRESPAPVPFLVAGYKVSTVVARPMTEPAAQQADLKVPFGHELMEFFLKGGIR